MKVDKWIEGNFASRCKLQVIAALLLQVGLLRVAGWVDFSLGRTCQASNQSVAITCNKSVAQTCNGRSPFNLQQKRSANLTVL